MNAHPPRIAAWQVQDARLGPFYAAAWVAGH